MTNRQPVVLDNGQFEQLQSGDSLDLGNTDIIGIQTLLHFVEYDNGNIGGTFAIDWTQGKQQVATLTDNVTISPAVFGFPGVGKYQLRLKQDGNNSWNVFWDGSGYDVNRWIGVNGVPQINLNYVGETIITFIFDGNDVYQELELVNQPTGLALTVGSQSTSVGILNFANSNGISFGLSGTQLTASGGYATNSFGMSTLGNTSGTTGVITGSALQLLFAGGNNITLSQSLATSNISGTMTINAGGMNAGLSTGGNTTGTSTLVNAQVILVGGNNLTISQSLDGASSSATLSFSIQGQVPFFEPYGMWQAVQTSLGYPFASAPQPFFVPFILPQNLTINEIVFPVSMSANSATDSGSAQQSWFFALYTRHTASTTRMDTLFSTILDVRASYNRGTRYGWTFGVSSSSGDISSQFSGMKLWNVPFVTALKPGEYWFAIALSNGATTGAANASVAQPIYQRNIMTNVGRIGVISNKTIGPMYGFGVYTTTAQMPASVGFSQISWSSGIQEYINFRAVGVS